MSFNEINNSTFSFTIPIQLTHVNMASKRRKVLTLDKCVKVIKLV